jgi:hypothetical protein
MRTFFFHFFLQIEGTLEFLIRLRKEIFISLKILSKEKQEQIDFEKLNLHFSVAKIKN